MTTRLPRHTQQVPPFQGGGLSESFGEAGTYIDSKIRANFVDLIHEIHTHRMTPIITFGYYADYPSNKECNGDRRHECPHNRVGK